MKIYQLTGKREAIIFSIGKFADNRRNRKNAKKDYNLMADALTVNGFSIFYPTEWSEFMTAKDNG